MKTFQSIKNKVAKGATLASVASLSAFFVGCGPNSESVVQSVNYSVSDQNLALNVAFNTDVELNMEANIPIMVKDAYYGTIDFAPGKNGSGFSVGIGVDLGLIDHSVLDGIGLTRNLPNGQPMSKYVKSEVLQLTFAQQNNIIPTFYIGIAPGQSTDPSKPQFAYIGTAIELGWLDKNFPAGLTLTQWIRDSQKRPIGVVSLFGPQLDADQNVVHSGGFFIMTNVADLVSYGKSNVSLMAMSNSKQNSLAKIEASDIELDARNAKKFQGLSDPMKAYKFKKFLEKLKKHYESCVKSFRKDEEKS